jgi:hypothetical protein
MSSLMHPVGPQPSGVYWRRRLAVAVGLVVVLALVATLVFVVLPRVLGGGDKDKAAAPEGSQPPASSAPASTQPVACTAEQLGVTVTADAPSYAAGALPVLAVAISNTSPTSCTVDAGEAAREVLITSGTDRIWSSKDGPAEPASRLLLLSTGGRDDQAITWQRIRSAEGCAKDLAAPRPGTYTAVVSVAGVTSAPAVFTLE